MGIFINPGVESLLLLKFEQFVLQAICNQSSVNDLLNPLLSSAPRHTRNKTLSLNTFLQPRVIYVFVLMSLNTCCPQILRRVRLFIYCFTPGQMSASLKCHASWRYFVFGLYELPISFFTLYWLFYI